MSSSIGTEITRLKTTVEQMADALGAQGEGYDIADMPFRDWGDQIRAQTQISAANQSGVNNSALRPGSDLDALKGYLEAISATPTSMMVKGAGSSASETLDFRVIQRAMSGSSGITTGPLYNAKTIILKDIKTVNLYLCKIVSGQTAFKKLVLRNVGVLKKEYGQYVQWYNGEVADFSGVADIDISGDLFYFANALKFLSFAGLSCSKTLQIGSVETMRLLETLIVGNAFTGQVILSSSSNSSAVRRVELPYKEYDSAVASWQSSIAVQSGAEVCFKTSALPDSGSERDKMKKSGRYVFQVAQASGNDRVCFKFFCGEERSVYVIVNGVTIGLLTAWSSNYDRSVETWVGDCLVRFEFYELELEDEEGEAVFRAYLKMIVVTGGVGRTVSFQVLDGGNMSLTIA